MYQTKKDKNCTHPADKKLNEGAQSQKSEQVSKPELQK